MTVNLVTTVPLIALECNEGTLLLLSNKAALLDPHEASPKVQTFDQVDIVAADSTQPRAEQVQVIELEYRVVVESLPESISSHLEAIAYVTYLDCLVVDLLAGHESSWRLRQPKEMSARLQRPGGLDGGVATDQFDDPVLDLFRQVEQRSILLAVCVKAGFGFAVDARNSLTGMASVGFSSLTCSSVGIVGHHGSDLVFLASHCGNFCIVVGASCRGRMNLVQMFAPNGESKAPQDFISLLWKRSSGTTRCFSST